MSADLRPFDTPLREFEANPDNGSHSAEADAFNRARRGLLRLCYQMRRTNVSSRAGMQTVTNRAQYCQYINLCDDEVQDLSFGLDSQPSSHEHRPFTNAVHFESALEGDILRRLRESSTAYEKVWTVALLSVMLGPFIFAILQLLPRTRSMMEDIASFITSGIPSSYYLVVSAKTVAYFPLLIQPYLHLRQRIHNISPSMKRTILDVMFVFGCVISAVFLSLGVSAVVDSEISVLVVFHSVQLFVILVVFG